MNQEPKSSRRIVSRSEYLKRGMRKVILSSGGASLYVLGLFGFALLLVMCSMIVPIGLHFIEVAMLTVIAAMAAATIYVGRRAMRHGVRLETGVPLTRANIADLPAPESLVRASSEPLQEQQAVLLRADVGDAQSGNEGQLLRASVGGEEQ